jgi:hypothetical protein
MVSAIALLAANRPTWQSVSAASIEFQHGETGSSPVLVWRIAQNGRVEEETIRGLNEILAEITSFVASSNGNEWRCMFLFVSRWLFT